MKSREATVSGPSGSDAIFLGQRLRTNREMRGWTQAELAERAGVTIRTIYNVEQGASTRRSSIEKICAGLEIQRTSLDQSVEAARNSPSYPLIHRGSEAEWYTWIDKRKSVPADNRERLQDPEERNRLGSLGLVPVFLSNPYLIMPEGPGTLFIEVHGRFEGPINEMYFRNCKILCLRGAVRCKILDVVTEISVGDLIGYRSLDLRWLEPLTPSEPPPLLLWMGAVQVVKPKWQ